MRVGIFGNINSGKSTLLAHLLDRFPNYPVMRIDDYRRRFGDGSFQADQNAIDRFVQDAAAEEHAFIECTGLGPLGAKLASALAPKSILILLVDTHLETCLRRIEDKDFSDTPYPPFAESLENTVARIDSEIQAGAVYDLWSEKALFIHRVSGQGSESREFTENIALEHYSLVAKIAAIFQGHGEISAAIWFGSGARGEFSRTSDIDLFLETTLGFDEILMLLSEGGIESRFTDHLGNKLWLETLNGIMVEMSLDQSLEGLDQYFSTSNVSDLRWSILTGGNEVIAHLKSIVPKTTVTPAEIRELLAEIAYYYRSLDSLIAKSDEYKYYFHSNIILHRIVQLKAIESGRSERIYLPLNAVSHFSADEISSLAYTIGADMQQHRMALGDWLNTFLSGLSEPRLDSEKYRRLFSGAYELN
jgi:predicted nucleotidyltransferase